MGDPVANTHTDSKQIIQTNFCKCFSPELKEFIKEIELGSEERKFKPEAQQSKKSSV